MSQAIVAQAKADLSAAGVSLAGNDGAFLITMEAASRIPGAGVLDKPSGNHADFKGGSYSVDCIVFQDGRLFDVLVDGGGANNPTWNAGDPIDPSRWRAAVSVLGPRVPVPPPVDTFALQLQALYAQYGRVATPADIEAHRGNPGGLPAVELLLRAAQGGTPTTPTVPAVPAATSTAYVKFNLKPVPGGGFEAYVKFDLKPVA